MRDQGTHAPEAADPSHADSIFFAAANAIGAQSLQRTRTECVDVLGYGADEAAGGVRISGV